MNHATGPTAARLIHRDALAAPWPIADASIDCCVTSVPYWGLRDYGFAEQIWLEPSPEAWCEKLVRVFREVRRVLKPEGTVWLNCGDAFAAKVRGSRGGKSTLDSYNPDQATPMDKARAVRYARTPSATADHGGWTEKANGGARVVLDENAHGIKTKDLIGQPWMLAKALRAPYYTGRILNIQDRIWLAAMIDAEGCMFIHRRKAGQHNGQGYHRKNDNYAPGLEVANTSERIVKRCMDITGLGSICSQSPDQNNRRRQTIYRWNLRTIECRDVIREIYPHLVSKQHQARLLCGCPSSGEDATRAHLGLIALHRGLPTDFDFKPPLSMFEPGWYLRSDIIWAKANPMPESVTDRPTRAHEYVFLLSKSPRYFYDAAAIAEPASENTNARISKAAIDELRAGKAQKAPDHWDTGAHGSIPKRTLGEKGETRDASVDRSGRGAAFGRGAGWRTAGLAPKHAASGHNGTQVGNTPAFRTQAIDTPKQSAPGLGIKNNDSFNNATALPVVIRNSRSVWTIPTQPRKEAHFAAFPDELPRRCILAGCPVGGVVLDPFCGRGTTLEVALRLGRRGVGIDGRADYLRMAQQALGLWRPEIETEVARA